MSCDSWISFLQKHGFYNDCTLTVHQLPGSYKETLWHARGFFVTSGSVILAVYVQQNKQNLLRFPVFEQILLFFIECLFNEISYENEKDIQQKLSKFAQILGIQNSTFKPTLIQKFSGINIYNALNLPVLLYGSKIWTRRKKNKHD
jgi:hypothetical protein